MHEIWDPDAGESLLREKDEPETPTPEPEEETPPPGPRGPEGRPLPCWETGECTVRIPADTARRVRAQGDDPVALSEWLLLDWVREKERDKMSKKEED